MSSIDRITQRALSSLRRASSALESACAWATTVTSSAFTTNVAGAWYSAHPVALRHDIPKAGSPRGSS